MLLGFRVANYSSVRDEAELRMASAGGQEPGSPAAARAGAAALPAAALYGPTASGKSSLLGALDFMRAAVTGSYQEWHPGAPVPRHPFRLTPDGTRRPTALTATFTCDSERYEYGFSVDDRQVTSERLRGFPGGRPQVLFDRTPGDGITFGRSLGGRRREIARLTRPGALYLSTAAANNHEQLTRVYQWFCGILPCQPGAGLRDSLTIREWEGPARPALRQLLRFAGTGATDIEVHDHEPRVSLVYEGAAGSVRLPAEEASSGTLAWLSLIGPLLAALRQGGILLADGLDDHLHPLLAAHLVGAFQHPATNPAGAQLLFSTSKPFLLSGTSPSHLRRDQVWVTEKDSGGATTLTPLDGYLARAAAAATGERRAGGRYAAAQFLDVFDSMEPR